MFPVSTQAWQHQSALHFLLLLGYLLVPLMWSEVQAAPYLQQPDAQTTEVGGASSIPQAADLPAVQEETPLDTAPLTASQQSQRHPKDTGIDILPPHLHLTDPEQSFPTIPSSTDNTTHGTDLIYPSIPLRLDIEGIPLEDTQQHKTFSVLPSPPIDVSDKIRKYAVDKQRHDDREVKVDAAEPDDEDDWPLLCIAIIVAVSLRVMLRQPRRWKRRPPAQPGPVAAVSHDSQQGRATTQGHLQASHLYRPIRTHGTVHKTTCPPPSTLPVWVDPQLWRATATSRRRRPLAPSKVLQSAFAPSFSIPVWADPHLWQHQSSPGQEPNAFPVWADPQLWQLTSTSTD